MPRRARARAAPRAPGGGRRGRVLAQTAHRVKPRDIQKSCQHFAACQKCQSRNRDGERSVSRCRDAQPLPPKARVDH